ncbi:MAG: glycosyltransferase family 2 protein [Gemmatimonadaceae bacterium]
MTSRSDTTGGCGPDLSLVIPCYNEAESIAYTVRRLVSVFEAAGRAIEIIAVDNGSTDSTGEAIAELARDLSAVRPHRVEVNQGYGFGLLSGAPLARGRWVGFIPADGQVDAEDVLRLYEAASESRRPVLAKVRRRFRMDGIGRKFVSISYNAFVRLLWPTLESLDVNGTPKLLPRVVLEQMALESDGWFLDPEIMIKAHYLGVHVLELNAFSRMRGNGVSHVRAATCWDFFRNLLAFRFGSRLTQWRASINQREGETDAPARATAGARQ